MSLSAVLLAGCGPDKRFEELTDKKKISEFFPVGELPWIPLGLTKESYQATEKRISKYVRVGMPRKSFLQKMKLNPVLGPEWSDRVTAGEGWFSELSRKNKYGELVVEEFSFGYYDGYRLVERMAVIVKNREVRRIARASWASEDSPPPPPPRVFLREISLDEEKRLIVSHYREKLQSKKSYLKIIPQLKKIRIGWTSAEVRLALGGSIYRIPNGYTYFQEGLLWNDGFVRNNSGPLSVVIMPFGYRDEKGRPHKKVVVRAEGGLVTAVFWQPDIYKKKK